MTSKAFDNATDANRQQGGRRNLIINGAMQVWQRGTSVTGKTDTDYSTADRWKHNASGGTFNLSRQDLTLGQTDIPQQFKYFYRVETTTGNNNTGIFQNIEDVTRLQGTHTVSFYAKGTNPGGGSFELELRQNFGSGGSPNVDILETFTVTSSWQLFTFTFTPASVSGKTIDDGTSYFRVYPRQPSADNSTDAWTLDITGVQLEVGTVATPFEHRSYGEELALCQRYYQRSGKINYQLMGRWPSTSGPGLSHVQLFCPMRSTPSMSTEGAWSSGNSYTTPTYEGKSNSTAQITGSVSQGTNTIFYAHSGEWVADAEL